MRSMISWLRGAISGASTYPPAPDGVTLYAVGDIHGRSDCLAQAHERIDRDKARLFAEDRAVEIYLGDYIDRGPDSRGVIDRLIARSARAETVMLIGNHEMIMQSFFSGQTSFEEWRMVGGLETLLSYGAEAGELLRGESPVRPAELAALIPAAHRRFLAELLGYQLFGRYCFVHAGLRPGKPIEEQSIEDLAWIRDEFLNHRGDFGSIVVHGHTPVNEIEFMPNRINIDTGAFATNRLSVVRIDGDGPSVLET